MKSCNGQVSIWVWTVWFVLIYSSLCKWVLVLWKDGSYILAVILVWQHYSLTISLHLFLFQPFHIYFSLLFIYSWFYSLLIPHIFLLFLRNEKRSKSSKRPSDAPPSASSESRNIPSDARNVPERTERTERRETIPYDEDDRDGGMSRNYQQGSTAQLSRYVSCKYWLYWYRSI